MGLFGRKKDEYSEIFDASTDSYDPDEDENEWLDETSIEEKINSVASGGCPKCGSSNGMKNIDNVYFECEDCGYTESAESYVEGLGL